MDNNGILNVGFTSTEKISLTATNNAITITDITKVTDSSNKVTNDVPVYFINRVTCEVLYNGITKENCELDFQYFIEEAEIQPKQIHISNDYIFIIDGLLKSYSACDITYNDTSKYTRMHADDTTRVCFMISSFLDGCTDFDIKNKLADCEDIDTILTVNKCQNNGTIIGIP